MFIIDLSEVNRRRAHAVTAKNIWLYRIECGHIIQHIICIDFKRMRGLSLKFFLLF